jgi:hypothetical protein
MHFYALKLAIGLLAAVRPSGAWIPWRRQPKKISYSFDYSDLSAAASAQGDDFNDLNEDEARSSRETSPQSKPLTFFSYRDKSN